MVKAMETLPIQVKFTSLLKSILLRKLKAMQMVPQLLSLQMIALKQISMLQTSNQELPILQLIRHLVILASTLVVTTTMCEDLSVTQATDWDFNDVVFDVKLKNGNKRPEITLRAAGGTLPLYIGTLTMKSMRFMKNLLKKAQRRDHNP